MPDLPSKELHNITLRKRFGDIGETLRYAKWHVESNNLDPDDLWLVIEFNDECVDLTTFGLIASSFPYAYAYVLATEDELSVHIRLYRPLGEDDNLRDRDTNATPD